MKCFKFGNEMFQIWSRSKLGEEKKFRESVSWERVRIQIIKTRGDPLWQLWFFFRVFS